MLQRIDLEPASRGPARWLRRASVAGLAIIALASGTLAADDAGRARISPDAAASPESVSGRARLAAESPDLSGNTSGKARLDSASPETPAEVSGRTRLVPESPAAPTRVSGRAKLVPNTAKSPISVSGKARLPQDGWARSKTRVPAIPATLSRILPPSELPPEDLFPSSNTRGTTAGNAAAGAVPADAAPQALVAAIEVQTEAAPAIEMQEHDVPAVESPSHDGVPRDESFESFIDATTANKPTDPASQELAGGDHYSDEINETFEAAHCRRMEQVMTGRSPGSMNSVGEWWHGHSQSYVVQNRHLVAAVVETPRVARQAAQQFVVEHTLEECPVPEVDFYDSNPIALSSPSTQPPVEEEAPVESGELNGTSRLKTDIRSIKPTLSYALRGIEPKELPDDFFEPIDKGQYVARQTSPTVLQWAPTNLWHYPLYFEDPSLERYGHSYHPLIQPFASTGRFATQLVGLPYQMTLHPVHSREYALGYYRPGEWAPKKCYQIPFNEEATLMEIATIAGLILIFP